MCFGLLTQRCAALSHNTMPQMLHVKRECAAVMLTAGMSTRAAPHLFDVHFTTINCHSCQYIQLVSHGVHVTTSAAHDLCPRLLHLHGYVPRQLMQQLICKTRGSLHRNCQRACGMGRHDVQQAQVLLIIHVAI